MIKITQDAINEAVDGFDADKVHKAMVALDWKWATCTISDDGVPTPFEIRQNARRLANVLACSTSSERGSGGIVAKRFADGAVEGIELVFELTASSGASA